MHRSILAVTILLGSAASASAADPQVPEPATPQVAVPAAPFDWSGLYVGGQACFGWGDADYAFPYGFENGPFTNHFNQERGDRFAHRMNGGLVGGHAGYNRQFGNLVVGIEASLSATNVGKSGVVSPFFPESDRFNTEVNWLATLTPRAGYAYDRWLFTAKGGLAYGQVNSRIERLGSQGEGVVSHIDETFERLGWTAGVGVDYALTDKLVVGLDYSFVDLGAQTVSRFARDAGSGAEESYGSTHVVDTSFQAITARVSWKLN